MIVHFDTAHAIETHDMDGVNRAKTTAPGQGAVSMRQIVYCGKLYEVEKRVNSARARAALSGIPAASAYSINS